MFMLLVLLLIQCLNHRTNSCPVVTARPNATSQQCQKMGFCLSHTSKIKLLDIVGNYFADSVIDQVHLGNKLQGTGDNWDMKIRPHDMLSAHQNIDLHYFASNLIVELVPCDNLSKTSPQKNICLLPNSIFLLSSAEATKLREDFKVLVTRHLVDNISQLSFLKSIVPQHIPHKYQQEMAKKSTIVPLPMQMKDEKKYEDVVDILDAYEQELEDIYVKACVVRKPNRPEPQKPAHITSGESATPDQAGAHFNKDDADDHMKGVSLPFGGDQMTRVRFAGAKDLRSGAHTAKQRFDHCSPFVSELFHTKMAYVQVIININNVKHYCYI